MSKVNAFVFARGGSKGLPRKNVLPIGGMPMVVHGIRLAQRLESVERVYVSSDCEEILKISEDAGAEVIIRPEELASDTAPEWLAWQHAINYLQKMNETFDIFLSLPTTSPLRSQKDINNALNALKKNDDAVITVTPSSRNPSFNMVSIDKEGIANLIEEKKVVSRRQDAPKYYDMTTVSYVSRPEFILSKKYLFSGRIKSIIVPKERAIDIDDITDALVAGFLYERNKNI